jgi:hypothetical protein
MTSGWYSAARGKGVTTLQSSRQTGIISKRRGRATRLDMWRFAPTEAFLRAMAWTVTHNPPSSVSGGQGGEIRCGKDRKKTTIAEYLGRRQEAVVTRLARAYF